MRSAIGCRVPCCPIVNWQDATTPPPLPTPQYTVRLMIGTMQRVYHISAAKQRSPHQVLAIRPLVIRSAGEISDSYRAATMIQSWLRMLVVRSDFCSIIETHPDHQSIFITTRPLPSQRRLRKRKKGLLTVGGYPGMMLTSLSLLPVGPSKLTFCTISISKLL